MLWNQGPTTLPPCSSAPVFFKNRKNPMTLRHTSLTSGTLLEERFSMSSQAYWVTKCTGCNHYNIPTKDEGIMDMIQPKGFSCCKCGKLMDPRTGHFVHQFPH